MKRSWIRLICVFVGGPSRRKHILDRNCLPENGQRPELELWEGWWWGWGVLGGVWTTPSSSCTYENKVTFRNGKRLVCGLLCSIPEAIYLNVTSFTKFSKSLFTTGRTLPTHCWKSRALDLGLPSGTLQLRFKMSWFRHIPLLPPHRSTPPLSAFTLPRLAFLQEDAEIKQSFWRTQTPWFLLQGEEDAEIGYSILQFPLWEVTKGHSAQVTNTEILSPPKSYHPLCASNLRVCGQARELH